MSIFDKRYLRGSGNIENVVISDMEIYSKKKQKALVLAESNIDNFVINNFVTSPKYNNTYALSLGYNQPTDIEVIDSRGNIQNYHKKLYDRKNFKADTYKCIRFNKTKK